MTYGKEEMLLKKALLIYQEKEFKALPDSRALEDITFSQDFEEKMQELIAKEKKPYYVIVNTTLKRVACVIVALFVSLSAMLSVDAIREPFFKYIIETFEKYSAVYFKDTSQITSETFVTYAPEYIPEGYKEVKREGSAEFMYNFITYFDENGNNIEFQQYVTAGHTLINTENISTEKIQINNHEAIYWENLGERFILFNDENYNFYISCVKEKINKEELVKIAQSIKTDKK